MKKQNKAAVLLILTVMCLSSCSLISKEDKVLYGPYKVEHVVDGDTITLKIDNQSVTVRMIGIDTPESVNPDESKNTPLGIIASDYTKELLTNKSVYLEYDVTTTDKYNRTLAYVYLFDKKTMVNKLLVQEGYAVVMTIAPNVKYEKEFYTLQKQAQYNHLIIWED